MDEADIAPTMLVSLHMLDIVCSNIQAFRKDSLQSTATIINHPTHNHTIQPTYQSNQAHVRQTTKKTVQLKPPLHLRLHHY